MEDDNIVSKKTENNKIYFPIMEFSKVLLLNEHNGEKFNIFIPDFEIQNFKSKISYDQNNNIKIIENNDQLISYFKDYISRQIKSLTVQERLIISASELVIFFLNSNRKTNYQLFRLS